MTKKIFILVVLTLFSVIMLGGRTGKHVVGYQEYGTYLNYQEFFEDFSIDNGEWTEYDPINRIELDYMYDQRLEFNHWIRYEPGYVYRPFSTTDFVLEYDIKISDDGGNANIIGPGFSDIHGTMDTIQNGVYSVYYAGFGGPQIDIATFVNGIAEWSWGVVGGEQPNRIWINTNTTYYVRFEKNEDTLKLSIFSDPDRTTHIPGSPKAVTTNLVDTTFNYFYAVTGYLHSPQNWEWTTGWIDNIYVRTEQQVAVCLIDIKPQSCPNRINVKSKGVLPAAVLGTEDFAVTNIDPASIRLEGVAPMRSKVEDVSAPVWDPQYDCECATEGEDGFDDLVLKFDNQEIVGTLGDVTDGEVLELTLTGKLTDGTPIQGKDCIVVISKGKNK